MSGVKGLEEVREANTHGAPEFLVDETDQLSDLLQEGLDDESKELVGAVDALLLSRNSSSSIIQRAERLIEGSGLTPYEKTAMIANVIATATLADPKQAEGDDSKLLADRLYGFRKTTLPSLLGADKLSQMGRELDRMVRGGSGVNVLLDAVVDGELKEDLYPEMTAAPAAAREEVVRYFADRGLLQLGEVDLPGSDEKTEEIVIPKKGRDKIAKKLESGMVRDAIIANQLYRGADNTLATLEDVKDIYERHNKERSVSRVDIKTNKPSYKVLPINELRLGHQDALAGLKLVEDEVDRVIGMDDAEKPDVILVSNLIQSDFSHSRSKKRRVLPQDLDSNNNQFAAAKLVLDKLRSTEVNIVHTLGSDDHQIAGDYTLDVIKELQGFLKDGGKADIIPYYMQNKLIQSKQYQEHYRFQLSHALPFCYRSGRRLRTADEVSELTGGRVEKSEYLLIFDYIKGGWPLPEELGIDTDELVKLGDTYSDGTVMADDVDLVFHTESGEHTLQYRHSLDLTAESLKGNHVGVAKKMLGNLGTMGKKLPEVLMYGRAQEAVHMTSSKATIVSLPGLMDSTESLNSKQYNSRAPGDPSLRANVVRNRFIMPAIDTLELTDDGITKHTFINKSLMEKADSLPRIAVFELCDFQTGSPTGRPDLQIKYLAYILEVAKEMPVVIQFAGDIIHGNIYSNFAFEGQSVGMIRPESQKLFMKSILRQVYMDVPDHILDNFVEVLVQQGNHDEEVKIRMPGNHTPNIDYLCGEFENILSPDRVRHDAVYHTEDGTPVPTWIAHSHYGAYDINTAHYHVMKGAKGDGGFPVYHAHTRAQGIGGSETPDIILGAHWHNEQAALIGNTLTVVGGAMAERSEFEDKLGYDAQVAGTCILIGGGLPPEVHFIHKKRLNKQEVEYGFFSPESLKDHGFHDDKRFDPEKHGMYSHDNRPKSGLQKALLGMARAASLRTEYEGQLENPNTYKKNGLPKKLNPATKRMFEVAERLLAEAA